MDQNFRERAKTLITFLDGNGGHNNNDGRFAEGAITPTGRLMVQIPLAPQIARAVLASIELRCVAEMLTIAAMLSVETLFAAEKPPHARSEADERRIKQKQEVLVRLCSLPAPHNV
jgi:HrpA-like RNA helicase